MCIRDRQCSGAERSEAQWSAAHSGAERSRAERRAPHQLGEDLPRPQGPGPGPAVHRGSLTDHRLRPSTTTATTTTTTTTTPFNLSAESAIPLDGRATGVDLSGLGNVMMRPSSSPLRRVSRATKPSFASALRGNTHIPDVDSHLPERGPTAARPCVTQAGHEHAHPRTAAYLRAAGQPPGHRSHGTATECDQPRTGTLGTAPTGSGALGPRF